MSRLFNRIFGITSREKAAEESMQRGDAEHIVALAELEGQLHKAEEAAKQSRSAASSLLRHLREDAPK